MRRTCRRTPAKPITIPNPMAAHLRPSVLGVSVGTNHEEEPAHSSEGAMIACNAPPSWACMAAHRRAIARLASMNGSMMMTVRQSLPDQRPELRPLQDLRHQGPQPEHQLDGARRRRRPELSEHVSGHGWPAAAWITRRSDDHGPCPGACCRSRPFRPWFDQMLNAECV
jgi:hypothetical protein